MIENVAGRRLKTIQVSLEVLSLILEHDGLILVELDMTVDSSKSSICSHLNALLEGRYLVKRDGVCRVSFRVVLLGERAQHRYPSDEAVERVVDELADATGQKTNFTVFEHDRPFMCYGSSTDEGRGTNGIRYRSEYHLRNTAAGEAILSELDRDEVVSIVDHWGLPRGSEGMTTNADRLFDALDEIAAQGYVVVGEEFVPDLIAAGAPVHDDDGRIVDGLSAGGPKYQVNMTRPEREFADELLNAAESLEAALSWANTAVSGTKRENGGYGLAGVARLTANH